MLYSLFFSVTMFAMGSISQAYMSPELAQCRSLQTIAEDHKVWKTEYQRFSEVDDLSVDQKMVLKKRTMALVIKRIEEVNHLSGQSGYRYLIEDSKRFMTDYEHGYIGKETANQLFNSGLIKLEDALDESLRIAQVENKRCILIENGNNQGPPSRTALN